MVNDALAVRRPAPGLPGAGAARLDDDLVGHHEGRIEADAELADQRLRLGPGVLGGELVEKGFGAGAGDRAEACGQILAGHADAVVGDGQGLGVLVERDRDREGRAVGDELGLGDRLVAQLLAGVGGVGDEFADEDFPVGIDRMNHQMQQARNIGLEALRGCGFGGRGRCVGGQSGPLFKSLTNGGTASRGERGYRRHSASNQGAGDRDNNRLPKRLFSGGPPHSNPRPCRSAGSSRRSARPRTRRRARPAHRISSKPVGLQRHVLCSRQTPRTPRADQLVRHRPLARPGQGDRKQRRPRNVWRPRDCGRRPAWANFDRSAPPSAIRRARRGAISRLPALTMHRPNDRRTIGLAELLGRPTAKRLQLSDNVRILNLAVLLAIRAGALKCALMDSAGRGWRFLRRPSVTGRQ